MSKQNKGGLGLRIHPPIDNNEFAEYLSARGVSCNQASVILKVDESTVYKWIRNDTKQPPYALRALKAAMEGLTPMSHMRTYHYRSMLDVDNRVSKNWKLSEKKFRCPYMARLAAALMYTRGRRS